ncbi:DUF3367 domain-containing protein [bacterium]|nr:DUF3367 domain-containing protein [bacterium]
MSAVSENPSKNALISKWWPVLALVALTVLATGSTFRPYPVYGHSAGMDAARLFEMHRAVENGDYYARWWPDLYWGYGSPLPTMYAPLGYLVAEAFNVVFLRGTALKLSFALAVLVAAIGMFLLVRRRTGPEAAFAAATLYVLAPYFLAETYVRSALAELWGFALIPWVIYFLFHHLDEKGCARCLAGAAISYGLLGIAHNVSALIYSPLLVLFILMVYPRKWWWRGALVLAVGLALSAFFWLPALGLKGAVQSEASLTTGYFSFEKHFIPFAELFIPRWGYGPPGSGPGGMSRQLGGIHWLIVIAGAMALSRWKDLEGRRQYMPFFVFFLVGFVFTQPLSYAFWQYVPLLKFVQFPWRFLMAATFGATVLAGVLFEQQRERFGEKPMKAAAVLMTIVAIGAYSGYAKAHFLLVDLSTGQMVEVSADEVEAKAADPRFVTFDEFLTVENVRRAGITGTASDDFLPVGVKTKPTGPPSRTFEIVEGSMGVNGREKGYNNYEALIMASTPGKLALQVFDFPGWRVEMDGEPIPTQTHPEFGTVVFDVPAGKHIATARYTRAPIHTAGDVVSLLGVLATLALLSGRVMRRRDDGA